MIDTKDLNKIGNQYIGLYKKTLMTELQAKRTRVLKKWIATNNEKYVIMLGCIDSLIEDIEKVEI